MCISLAPVAGSLTFQADNKSARRCAGKAPQLGRGAIWRPPIRVIRAESGPSGTAFPLCHHGRARKSHGRFLPNEPNSSSANICAICGESDLSPSFPSANPGSSTRVIQRLIKVNQGYSSGARKPTPRLRDCPEGGVGGRQQSSLGRTAIGRIFAKFAVKSHVFPNAPSLLLWPLWTAMG